MTLPTKRMYIEAIVPTHDWVDEWDELANLLRGRQRSAGYSKDDMARWVEYPVYSETEKAYVTASIHVGDAVVVQEGKDPVVYNARAFAEVHA